MAERFCTNCGKALVPGVRFCNGCGRAVGQGANRQTPNPNANRTPNPNINRNPNPNAYHNPNPRPNVNYAPPVVPEPVRVPDPAPMPVLEDVTIAIPKPVSNPVPNTWYPVNEDKPQTPPVVETPVPQPPVYQPPVQQPPVYPADPVITPAEPMTKKKYRKVCTNEKYRKELKTSAIILYVLIVINALFAIAVSPVALIDVGIYLALTLGMHLGKNKGCAVGVLCYAIFCMVVTLINTGKPGGWLWLIVAFGAIKAFKIADEEYASRYGG